MLQETTHDTAKVQMTHKVMKALKAMLDKKKAAVAHTEVNLIHVVGMNPIDRSTWVSRPQVFSSRSNHVV